MRTTTRQFQKEAKKLIERMREAAQEFRHDPEEQQARIERGRDDFLFFCKTYLPHYFDRDFDDVHATDWNGFREIQDEPVFVIGPPDVGKSTFFEIADTLHGILYERFRYGVIGCYSLEQSGDRVSFIRIELEENARIIQDFGNLKGRKWLEDDFITTTEIRLKAISFLKRIYGLTFRNWRPDYCRLSDIEDEKTVASPRITGKIYRWILRSLLPRLTDGYSFVYNANKLAPNMAIVRFNEAKDEKGEKKYYGGEYPLRKGGKCQFPNMWPAARIAKQEDAYGKVEFARVYDFQGIDDDRKFREEWVVKEAPEILIGVPLEVFGGIDPSPDPNEQLNNCPKALVIIGVEKKTIIHVVDAWIRVGSVDELISSGYHLYDKWNHAGSFRRFLLKGTKVEELYRKQFDSAARERGRLPLPITFANETMNKIRKLGNKLPSYFERGILRFVASNGHVQEIIDEALLFPDGLLDGLDALDMAIEAAELKQSSTNLVVAL